MATFDRAIVGGGILGLATAWELLRRKPGTRVVLLEKEPGLALHQSGRNSGVIHAGLYYKPGSHKARLAVAGNRAMVAFCREHGVRHEVCGKLIVATEDAELPRLQALAGRAAQNGIEVLPLTCDEAREREPQVRCLDALWVPSTGIVSYREVCEKLASLIQAAGGELMLSTKVLRIAADGSEQVLETSRGEVRAKFVVACAGLQSDRLARASGAALEAEILPFRGEYYELAEPRRRLVRGLIYPVPNPAFPFLGVHLTRGIDGSVHAGPNAVLAMAREGYRRRDVDLGDLRELLEFPGLWNLLARHGAEGLRELVRSLSRRVFADSLRRLVPALNDDDLVPAPAGVRAQAVLPDGALVDDFLFVRAPGQLHVCNAPSPAATASLAIAREIADQLPEA